MSFFQESSDSWQASDGLWYPGEHRRTTASDPTPPPRPAERPASYLIPFHIADAYRWSLHRLRKDIGHLVVPTLVAVLAIGGLLAWVFATYEVEPNAQWGYPALGRTIVGIFGVMLILTIYQAPIIHRTIQQEGSGRTPPSPAKKWRKVAAYLTGAVLLSVLTAFGTVLCAVPGVTIALCGYYFGWFVLGEDLGPVRALRASTSMVTHNLAAALGVAIVASILLLVGGTVVCVGLLVTLPLVSYTVGYSYFCLRHGRQMGSEAAGRSPPPV